MVPLHRDPEMEGGEEDRTCKWHGRIKEILEGSKANSALKWKAMAGLLTLIIALFGISMNFADRSADRVILEMREMKKELVMNQDTIRAQMFQNTRSIGELVSSVNRLETERSNKP